MVMRDLENSAQALVSNETDSLTENTRYILARLETVPWAEMETIYDTGSAIPGYIRRLVSADADTSETIIDLWCVVCDEGTPRFSMVAVVPFIADLALEPSTPDRAVLIRHLLQFSLGYPGNYIESLISGTGEFRQKVTPENVNEKLAYEQAKIAAYKILENYAPTYISLCLDPDPEIRRDAIGFITFFPKYAGEAIEVVSEAARREEDISAQVTAIISLGFLASFTEEYTMAGELVPLLLSSEPAIADATAIALGILLKAELPETALERLRELKQFPRFDAIYGNSLGWDEVCLYSFASCLMPYMGQG